ncbi:sigma-70 family RNA polymerase sigma factor [Arthrobacter sp. NEB 688]|uniref:sigma-70 family RNA polymerase sigma factor n=1 Tax=Arthrobacter sp. NEB 688 TaxID=904039 RepID=UPI00156695A5|nr:sigma-70 family RNA polymerase sigma factor [Arthrobacter sp. NEB 688]QKE83310.1 sigma-70 family RNA polymerase sigma factor [Arthrobacter sp. NEB 688]
MTPTGSPTQAAVDGGTRTDTDFDAAVGRYRRELLAHCYRMTGSPSDAEDLVQEVYLRAWRAYDSFEGRSSLRTWLHRIATNVCLTALEGKDRRPLPSGLGTASSEGADPLDERTEVPWLGPMPDAALLGTADPADVVAERDTVRLAFVAALQHLPARQRAVLVLRDVLRWSAAEVAEATGSSVASVNSALQRARATLGDVAPSPDAPRAELDDEQRELLDRYVDAFWRKDPDAIARLFTQDAVWEMPPFAGWYQGPRTIAELVDTQCPGGRYDMPMLATTCNGQPAFGLYLRETGPDDDVFRPFQLQVLELEGALVKHAVVFFDTAYFALAGLPDRLGPDDVPARPGE